MGTVIFRQTTDRERAEDLARRFYPYEPYWIKEEREIWRMAPYRGRRVKREPSHVGDEVKYFTDQEQVILNSRAFLELQPFHYLIGGSTQSGQVATTLRRMTLA